MGRYRDSSRLGQLADYQEDGDADLQQDPDINDDVAVDEERSAVVGLPVLVVGVDPVDPRLAGREAEHGAQPADEVAEVVRRGPAKEVDAHDGVCPGTARSRRQQHISS
jgi:hypothetical protein